MDDLQQIAATGLLNAIDRFDPDRGSTFTSFAIPTILGELRWHFRDRTWATAELLAMLDSREAEIDFLRFHADLTQDVIARRVGVSQMHVSRVLHRSLARLRPAVGG